jgi:uncharacterized membrane protein
VMGLTVLLVIFSLTGLKNFLRTVLGIAFVVFCPGYALQAALFPGQKEIGVAERIALSFALSVAVVPLLVLFLTYTPWSIKESSVLFILSSYVFSVSILGIYRRSLLPEDECFKVLIPKLAALRERFKGDMVFSTVVTGVFIFSLICFYLFAGTARSSGFSEFYLTTADNRVENFSQGLKRGSEVEFVVGLVNFELEDCDYRIKIYVDSRAYASIGPFMLKRGEKREKRIRLSPGIDFAGKAKVECVLFKDNDRKPYRTLQLWIE